jgi:hypothetical protein
MIKIKYHVLLLFAAVSFNPAISFAQSLYFCEGVDDDGYAINESSVFNIPDGGGYLYFLVRLGSDEEINCDEVLFDIYKVDSGGEETFDNTVYNDVEPDWNWFWKKITFYDRGTYKVYVYDEDWKLLTSSTVKIKFN